jgi:peptidoglycan hydrolase-like protein with peptidoglycan-binding domain
MAIYFNPIGSIYSTTKGGSDASFLLSPAQEAEWVSRGSYSSGPEPSNYTPIQGGTGLNTTPPPPASSNTTGTQPTMNLYGNTTPPNNQNPYYNAQSTAGAPNPASSVTIQGDTATSTLSSHQYNAVTGAKNPNYVAPVTTPTPTTPAQTSSSSSTTTPKPTGINTISSTLTFGSQGDQVKALQTYLSGMGLVGADSKPLKADGIYGADTKAAVMQFQQQHGLTQDGIFGPKSLAAMQNVTNTSAQYQTIAPATTTTPPATTSSDTSTTTPPSITGNPAQDALLQELQTYITNQQNQGLTINPALNFDQATLDKFLTTAQNQVHPYYASQIAGIKADVLQALPGVMQDYNNKIADTTQTFQNDLSNSRESNANAGLAFSGSRAKGELGMADTQNRNLQSLSTTYGNQLYNLGSTAEQKLGAANTPSLGSLNTYSANLGGNGSIDSTGSTTPYTPGQYQIGSLTNEEQAAITARNQALKSTASADVVAGRSYNDLFQ